MLEGKDLVLRDQGRAWIASMRFAAYLRFAGERINWYVCRGSSCGCTNLSLGCPSKHRHEKTAVHCSRDLRISFLLNLSFRAALCFRPHERLLARTSRERPFLGQCVGCARRESI